LRMSRLSLLGLLIYSRRHVHSSRCITIL
jgi:hypothetical protein